MKTIKVLALALCFLILIGTFPAPVLAENGDVTLNVHYTDGAKVIIGATFNVYLVATPDSSGEYSPTTAFKDYPVDFSARTEQEMYDLATTLEGYVLHDALQPLYIGTTGGDGVFVFTTDGKATPNGMYLVMGEQYIKDDIIYTSESFLIYLPAIDDGGEKQYDVTVHAKYSVIHKNSPPIYRKVVKIWDDKNAESDRPTSVEVTLLKNGAVYETVVLDKDNNWSHVWYNLESTARWCVIEESLDNYTVTLTRDSVTYYLKNSYKETPPPPDDLPQTGQLWWPVPVLAFLGIVFISIGVIRYYKKKQIEE